MSKTKKELILENARKDPFLKIETIARKAGTTPRYVRTILSEANLSLMNLRKEYARKMEYKYNGEPGERLLCNYLLNTPFNNDNIERIDESVFNNPGNFINISDIANRYEFLSFIHRLNRDVWCVNTILISREIFDIDSGMELRDVIKEINDFLIKHECNISDISLDIDLTSKQLSGLFQSQILSPLFSAKQTVDFKMELMVLMLSYFDPRIVSLSLSYNNGLLIGRKSIAG